MNEYIYNINHTKKNNIKGIVVLEVAKLCIAAYVCFFRDRSASFHIHSSACILRLFLYLASFLMFLCAGVLENTYA